MSNNNSSENELFRMMAGYTVTMRDYIALLKVNWKQVVIITGAFLILAAAYALNSPYIYQSSTMLKISKPKGSILDAAFSADLRETKTPFVQNEIGVLKSYTVRENVAKALIDSLKHDRYPQYYMVFGYDDDKQAWVTKPEYKIVGELEKIVSVEQMEQMDIITVTAESPSAYEAALIVNIYANVYHEMNLVLSRAHMSKVRDYFEKQTREKQESLTDAESTLRNYLEKDNTVALDEQSRALISQLTDFESRKNATKIDLAIAEKSLTDYKNELARQEPRINDYMEKYAIEPYLEELQKGIAQLELKRDIALRNEDGKKNEAIKSYDDRITELKEKRDKKLEVFKTGMLASSSDEVKKLLQKVLEAEVRYHGLIASYGELNSIVNRYESKFNSLPEKTIQLAKLEREKGESEKLYLMLQEKYQEAIINEQSTPDNVQVIDRGRMAHEPVKPHKTIIMIMGLFLGMVLSVVSVIVRSYFDNKVHTPEEIQKLSLNLLGWIPKFKMISDAKKNGEFIVCSKPDSLPSEAYRVIRTRLQFSRQNSMKTVLLTSATPHEGKTLTAVNLAGSFAQAGKKTVIIDCDLRRPRAHKLFNQAKAPGISDYLRGAASYAEIIRKSQLEKLYLIPSGSRIDNPAEILGSLEFARFIQELKNDFDIVVIDSSPVLAVTDAEILSHMVDVAILVVAAHSTEIEIMKNAAELLQKDQNLPVGVLLNNFVYKNGYGRYYKSYTYYDERRN